MSSVAKVGINDANYVVVMYEKIGDKRIRTWTCPFYRSWSNMLKRCYSVSSLKDRPTYTGCYVCDDWLYFSKFKSWMQSQEWEGKVLDKDLLVKGNKVYSPNTCLFISSNINTFITGTNGVSFDKERLLYKAYISIDDKYVFLGRYPTAQQAYEKWLERKHELACQLADNETDSRIKIALKTRYLKQ